MTLRSLTAATFTFLLASFSICGSRTSAQTAPDLNAEADAAYQAKEWTRAADLYGRITSENPKSGRAWYRLGIALQGKANHESAVAAFQKAIDAGAPVFLADFALASSYASLKDSEKALDYLEKAASAGFNSPDQLSGPEWVLLRNDSRFAKAAAEIQHNAAPCSDSPENRQFDFWIGEWNVVSTQDGIPRGHSRIALILGKCVIEENWSSLGVAYEGKSYNVYNSSLQRWEQFWVDNSQGMIHFYGGLKDGVMDYWTDDMPQPGGKKLRRHLQFFNLGPDKVRQFSQGSNDGGKTWSVEYDLTYNRVK